MTRQTIDRRTLAIVLGALAVCLGWVALTISQGHGNCIGLSEITAVPLGVIKQATHAKMSSADMYYLIVCAQPRHQLEFEFAATIAAATALIFWERKSATVPH